MPVGDTNYLRNYVLLNKDTEVPNLFAIWCGIAGVSCALGRRVWLDMGHYPIFPNFYIVLVAGSGMLRKSTAISVVEGILRRVEPGFNLIAQKITPEGLIDAIKTVETANGQNLLAEKAEGFVICDELATFINKQSFEAGLVPLLIPFFDCKDSFSYKTMSRGNQVITNACLGILGASTVDWINRAIPESAVGGGFTSRVIFVYVEEPTEPFPFTSYTPEKQQLREWLITETSRIASLQGEMKLDQQSREFYEHEYIRWRTEGKRFFEDPNLTGYASRRNMHLLKLSMILAVASRREMIIRLDDIKGAKVLLDSSEKTMPMVLSLITTSEQGQLTNRVRTIIRKAGTEGVTRSDLLREMSNKIGTRELDQLLDTLEHSNQLRRVVLPGQQMKYFSLGE